jgi:hypothetical protein
MFFLFALYALYGSKKILTCPSYMPYMPYMVQKKSLHVLLICPICLYGSKKPLCPLYVLYAFVVQKNLYVLFMSFMPLWFKKTLCP